MKPASCAGVILDVWSSIAAPLGIWHPGAMRARWLFRPVCFRRQHRTWTHVIIATLTGALTVPLLFPVESRIYVTGSVSSSRERNTVAFEGLKAQLGRGATTSRS